MQKKKKRKLENDVKRVPNQASFQSNRFPIRIRNYSWNESHNPSLFRVFASIEQTTIDATIARGIEDVR